MTFDAPGPMSHLDAPSVIRTKRDGGALSDDAIDWVVDAYTRGDVAEAQMSALLMAIFLRGMTSREIARWTAAMIASGETLDFSDLRRDGKPLALVDKHSTGGVGDKITIKIKNASDSTLPHSVDYHASRLTLGGGHVQVKPGEEGTFEFTAEYPGVFMYHCATAPVLHHIGMGMYGMLIVQPKEGFGPEMPEYAITQSELYASSKDIDENRLRLREQGQVMARIGDCT